MVGKAGMIGSAKFVLTGSAMGLSDSAVIIALMMDATNTFTAIICAELGSSTPEADGSFLVREGLPRPNAFISS
jgi:amino acid transporter